MIESDLKILHLEDNRYDAELIQAVLEQNFTDISVTLTDNRNEFISILESGNTDLVLADYTVPGFSGPEALKLAREKIPGLPFIFVSGTIGEERAVETLLEGANDYILKDRLDRLVPAVSKVSDNVRHRRKIIELENVINLIAGSTNDVIYNLDREHKVIKWLSSMNTMLGYSENSFTSDTAWWEERIHPDDKPVLMSSYTSALESGVLSKSTEYRFRKADGTYAYIDDKMYFERDASGRAIKIFGSMADISERKKLEDIQRWESEFYRNLLEDANIWIHVLDTQGNLLIWNRRAKELSGYSKEELFDGGNGWDTLTRGGYQKLKEIFWRLLNEQSSIKDFEQRIYTKDGRELIMVWSSNFVKNHKNEIIAVMLLGKDVTAEEKARQQLLSSEKYYRSLIESSSDYIFVCDEAGVIKYASSSFQTSTGISTGDITGQSIFSIIDLKDSATVENFIKGWLTGNLETGKFEVEITSPVRGQVFLEIKLRNMLSDPDIRGIIVNARDISERKMFEKELILAKDQAEEMNRLKSSFFANMSHELRTPLIGIMGFAEILADYENDPEVASTAGRILASSRRLNHTLNMILDLRKLELSDTRSFYEETDITGILNALKEDFTPEAQEKGIEIRVNADENIIFETDRELLLKALLNIISNAVKYTESGFVELAATRNASGVMIKVKDTGIGIPAENQQNIFVPFKQVSEGFSRAYEGSGLGLTIAKKITDLLKGEIRVSSELNKGSEFVLVFPEKGSR